MKAKLLVLQNKKTGDYMSFILGENNMTENNHLPQDYKNKFPTPPTEPVAGGRGSGRTFRALANFVGHVMTGTDCVYVSHVPSYEMQMFLKILEMMLVDGAFIFRPRERTFMYKGNGRTVKFVVPNDTSFAEGRPTFVYQYDHAVIERGVPEKMFDYLKETKGIWL